MEITVPKYITESKNIKIRGITLLSENEFRAHESLIPHINCKWWLKSPNSEHSKEVMVVDESGNSTIPYLTDNACIKVRPVLLIDFHIDNFTIGDMFKFNDKIWTIISFRFAICNDHIGEHYFRNNLVAKDANRYNSSDIKKYIEHWFEDKNTKEYDITIEENISKTRTFTVKATSEKEAMEIAKEKYYNGEFVLANNIVTHDRMSVYDKQKKTSSNWIDI